jgi:hypothetical protein
MQKISLKITKLRGSILYPDFGLLSLWIVQLRVSREFSLGRH